ncbi:MAG: DUF975 domain-containing protein [Oscillospiraceae bacterium]
MWNGSILKSNARVALSGRYWISFLVTSVFILLAEGPNLLLPKFMWFSPFHSWWRIWSETPFFFPFHMSFEWPGLLYVIFLVHPLAIGVSRYFVRNHYESTPAETMFSGFRWDYLNGVAVMFLTRLFILLWTFLFIIPGIVKLVQYSMVPFLLSDNPSLPGERARQISRQMTDGQKGEIFLFWLSFLGWFLLGAMCFVVGILFVIPYFVASQTELYLMLRDRALSLGFVRPEELCLTPPKHV